MFPIQAMVHQSVQGFQGCIATRKHFQQVLVTPIKQNAHPCLPVRESTRNVPSFASGLEFLMNAENLAKMSIPAVFDSGCLAPSLINLKRITQMRGNNSRCRNKSCHLKILAFFSLKERKGSPIHTADIYLNKFEALLLWLVIIQKQTEHSDGSVFALTFARVQSHCQNGLQRKKKHFRIKEIYS